MPHRAVKKDKSNLDGITPLTEDQAEYLEWYVDPEREGTETGWAQRHGLTRGQIGHWKNQPRFRVALQKRLDELNLSPERTQAVLDNLHKTATKSQDPAAVQAAKAYLQYVERMAPERKPVDDRAVKDLTDQELADKLEERLTQQKLRLVENE